MRAYDKHTERQVLMQLYGKLAEKQQSIISLNPRVIQQQLHSRVLLQKATDHCIDYKFFQPQRN